jgi:hypothetical protein
MFHTTPWTVAKLAVKKFASDKERADAFALASSRSRQVQAREVPQVPLGQFRTLSDGFRHFRTVIDKFFSFSPCSEETHSLQTCARLGKAGQGSARLKLFSAFLWAIPGKETVKVFACEARNFPAVQFTRQWTAGSLQTHSIL